jgi:branched-subunit amino acid ABC-type transport system permease component
MNLRSSTQTTDIHDETDAAFEKSISIERGAMRTELAVNEAKKMNPIQVLVNGMISAGELGIVAIGLTMTFSVLRFANFAHTETAVVGAYLTFLCNVSLGWNLALSMTVAMAATGCVGVLIYAGFFRLLRNKGDVAPMIASLGIAIAIRNVIQAIWGPEIIRYDYEIKPGARFLGAFITTPQIGILITVPAAMLLFHAMLQYTSIGKAMRATAADAELAQASGIDTDRIIRLVWFIGSAFAGLGGALLAWDTQLDPQLGFVIVIPVFCCVLIGGVGSIYGAIFGALIVGLGQNVIVSLDFSDLAEWLGLASGDWSLPTAYKPAVVYVAVIMILLLRPRGLTSREA